MTTLRYGAPAPDFTLPSTQGGDVRLSSFKGQADVVLAFYCYDFGRIWTPELSDLAQVAKRLQEQGAVILAVSGDSPFCHTAFAQARSFPFPLLSDVHRSVVRAFGVLDEDRNVAYRSTFVIDREGVLRWGQAGDREMIRDGTEIQRVLGLIASLRKHWGREINAGSGRVAKVAR